MISYRHLPAESITYDPLFQDDVIKPYTEKYKEWFDCILKLESPGTKNGWLEMTYNSNDFQYSGLEVVVTRHIDWIY